VNRESAGILAGMNNIGDNFNVPRLDILAPSAELTEVTGFEVGLEQNVGSRRLEPEEPASQ